MIKTELYSNETSQTRIMTREIKGRAQLQVVRDALSTLAKPSTSREIFRVCQTNPNFDVIFDKHAYARMRTILQRYCPATGQGATAQGFRTKEEVFLCNRVDETWSLKAWADELAPKAAA